MRGNKIHDGKQGGVYVCNGGLGTLEDNDITGSTLSGVQIRTSADPALRGNQIHDTRGTAYSSVTAGWECWRTTTSQQRPRGRGDQDGCQSYPAG